ncbi:MAG: hypothetical protein ACT4OO_01960 [Nitrospiraceae bacterium]
MWRIQVHPIAFLLSGLGWLIVASLLGLAVFIGIVRGTALPAWLRLVHAHGALVGGVIQIMIGAVLLFNPPLSMTARDQRASHPILYCTVNGGTIGLLIGFGQRNFMVVGMAGLLIIAACFFMLRDTWRHIRNSVGASPVNLWFYAFALIALLTGLAIGEALAFRWITVWYGHARLAHIHLSLLGFVTLTIVGTMHSLLPTILHTDLHSQSSARFVFVLLPIGIIVLLTGFSLSTVWIQIVAGVILIAGALLYADNMFRTWLDAGKPENAAADHLLVATFFLVIAIITGMLVGVNYLWDPPALAFGALHLVAYTHAALVGFVLQTIFGALSHLVPVTLAVTRVESHKKRGLYLEQLTGIIDRWRAAQIGGLSLGTMGLAVVATLTWNAPLNSLVIQISAWVSFTLLLFSFTLFAAKLGHLLGKHPSG